MELAEIIQEDSTDRIGSITLLRGILASLIVWWHLQPAFGEFTFLISFPGRITVWLFFVLTGFNIYNSFETKYGEGRKEILRFYFNRAIRILPLFYLTTLISWLVHLYYAPQVLPNWREIIKTLLIFDFNLYGGIFIFTPAWFIGIIIYFYLISPVVCKAYKFLHQKYGFKRMFLGLILISVICHWAGYLVAGSFDIRNIIGCLPFFLFGFFAYNIYKDEYYFNWITKFNSKFLSIILIALLLFGFYLYQNKPSLFFKLPMEIYIGILGVFILLQFIRNDQSSTDSILEKIFKKMGKYSYGLFLWHPIVITLLFQTCLLHITGPPFNSASIFILAFFITLITTYIISYSFWHILEKPYNNLYMGKIQ